LFETHFEGARLFDARFEDARLVRARFAGAVLDGAHFDRANLDEADLRKAVLGRPYFADASLRQTLVSAEDVAAGVFTQARDDGRDVRADPPERRSALDA
jgi:uncharacterized protein YjbI with pentapeptide repeats